MAFPTKVIPFSEACKSWLNQTYAAKNHNHDTVYSKLGHTHTDVGFKYPDYKNARIFTDNQYTLYKANADGYVRFAATTGQSCTLLTNRISEFDSRIYEYQFNGTDYNGYSVGALVKYDGKYYQCIKQFTNATKLPGTETNYWRQVASWLPVIMHSTTSWTAEDDHGFGTLMIPVTDGTYLMVIRSGDTHGRTMRLAGAQTSMNTVWFVPFQGNSASSLTQVLKSDNTPYTMSYDSFIWDTVLMTISGLFRNLKIAKS